MRWDWFLNEQALSSVVLLCRIYPGKSTTLKMLVDGLSVVLATVPTVSFSADLYVCVYCCPVFSCGYMLLPRELDHVWGVVGDF